MDKIGSKLLGAGQVAYTATSLKDIAEQAESFAKDAERRAEREETLRAKTNWRGQAAAYRHMAQILNNCTLVQP